MDRYRLGEGFRFEEDLVVLRRCASDAHGLAAENRQFPGLVSVQAEDRNLRGGSSNVGNKKAVAYNRPLLDPAVAFGNYINPFRLTLRRSRNSTIRRFGALRSVTARILPGRSSGPKL